MMKSIILFVILTFVLINAVNAVEVEIVIDPNPATTETEWIAFGFANFLEDNIQLMCLPPEAFAIRDSLGEIIYYPESCATIISVIAPAETLFCASWELVDTLGIKVPVGTYYVEMDYYINLDGYLDSSSFRIDPPLYTDPEDISVSIPGTFSLFQNYPNPFNPTTTITFELPLEGTEQQDVALHVYDIRGRVVTTLIDSPCEAGRHQIVWDGSNDQGERVPSGVYFSVLKTRDRTCTRKLMLLK